MANNVREVEAIKFDGKNLSEVCDFFGETLHWYRKDDDIFICVKTSSGIKDATPGDYITKEESGFCLYKPESFEEKFK